ncbi:hypothetical protein [Aequorivita sinensis]|uniref:hypothetical protein n=1 Tax=Aequorivita sinensis TaxID=1382458 RepID=UPI00111FA457|nr:hypothetical protein [Aequorivita sinensis]
MAQQQSVEEIDLGYLFKKLKETSKNLIKLVFKVLDFYLKFWIVVLALILLGVAYGFYLDSNAKNEYENQGIIIPNFESVDYLYNNIEYFNNKIKTRDTVFLKQVLAEDFGAIKKIEIEPISDIYNMMTKSKEQTDVFRIIYQNQELDKFFEDLSNSKYFKYHKINFVTRGEVNPEMVISKILDYWNSNQLYGEYSSLYQKNADYQVDEYRKMNAQIDSILSSVVNSNQKDQLSGVIINENSNLFALFDRKKEILDKVLEIEKKRVDYKDVVRLVSMDYNKEIHHFSNKIKYPIIFIFLFSLGAFIIYAFKYLRQYAEQE